MQIRFFCVAAVLAGASMAANAGSLVVSNNVTGLSELPIPVQNYFGGGPISVTGGPGGGYTWSSTNVGNQGGSVFGYNGGYGFGGNGSWDGSFAMIGLNDSTDSYAVTDIMTFTFDNPVNAFGGLFNYLPGSNNPTVIDVYGAGNTLIGSYDLTFNDGGATNSGQWLEFSSTTPIDSFTMSDNYIGLGSPTPSASPVPEPNSLLLLGTGVASLAGFLRRKLTA